MRYLIILGAAAAVLGLSACSKSDGEDGNFFERNSQLSSLVFRQCNSTPENTQPFNIFNNSFGNEMLTEKRDPASSRFFNRCIDN